MTALILDDSSTVRTKIEDLLLALHCSDLNIYQFENGNKALEFFEENDVDIIFSAIEIEGMDGITFVDLILRKDPDIVSKMFIVTSQVNTDHMHDIKDVGAKRFIKKPINNESFTHLITAEINNILRKSLQ